MGNSSGRLLGEKKWRCQKYGPLGMLETIVKLIAAGIGFASLTVFDSASRNYSAEKIVQFVFLGLCAVYCTICILHRLAEKDIFALGFMSVLAASHWVLFVVMFKSLDPGAFVFAFSFILIMGEYIKMMFLAVQKDFEVIWCPKPALWVFSVVLIVFYLLILILQVVIYQVTFDT
eukprot:TRINITY_DN5539_c0_g1_i1.p1 TRINITY_DN5539_c0_g1~~TRINITY_DN5539_c0_g1_i1.p1  ORF type:complete len:175 (-),score=26.05 TRINITY_DN5539_c0_g1_i1:149-673(-)